MRWSSAVPDDLDAYAREAEWAAARLAWLADRLEGVLADTRRASTSPPGLEPPAGDLRRLAGWSADSARLVRRSAAAFRSADRLLVAIARGAPVAPAAPGRAVELARVTMGGSRGASWGTGAHTGPLGLAAGAHLGSAWSATATGGLTGSRAYGEVRADLEVGAGATAGAEAELAGLDLGVEATVRAGLSARGDARVVVGRSGVDAAAGGEVLLGGSARVAATADALGARGGARGGVSYGVGAAMGSGASFSVAEIAFRLDLGMTFGLGVEGGFELALQPAEVAGAVGSGIRRAWRLVS